MNCPKCGQPTPAQAQFCVRCHAPLRYTCPSCKHQQDRGGQCERCGADFAKFAALLILQAETQAAQRRERANNRSSILKQLLLLPITGGFSLIKYFRSRMGSE